MNKFLIRTPIFDLGSLNEFYNSNDPEQFIFSVFAENDIFRESIYLYSISLYKQANKYINNDINKKRIKKKSRIANSLIKYFLRMCYRATPFGMAAGISTAEFSNDLEHSNINYIRRTVRIDSGVFANILKRVNSIKAVRSTINYRTNNTLFQKNRYFRFVEKKELKNSFDFILNKVERTEFLDEVLNLGYTTGISLNVIKDLLKDENDLSRKDIEEFFSELIDSQLIISEFQYNVLEPGFQQMFVQRLKELPLTETDDELSQIILTLEKAFDLVDYLSSFKLESTNSLTIIQEIDELLKPYNSENKTAIQIDLINDSNCKLPYKIKKDIEQNLSNFSIINAQISSENKELKTFQNAFVNRYGHKTVPLLEVLDSDIGIGYPVKPLVKGNKALLGHINIKISIDEKMKFTKWDSFVMEKYLQCLNDNKNKIEITENDLKLFSLSKNTPIIKDSLLFTGQVIKTKNNNFKYHFNSVKVGAAQSILGRFTHGSKKINEICENLTSLQTEVLAENQVLAELLHFSQPKLGNIASRKNYYKYHIPIIDFAENDLEHSIPLRDLYLNVSKNKLILYSENLDKQVIPRIGCAQNTQLLTNPIYKFLAAINDDYYLDVWDWGIFYFRRYLPRVQFKGFILSKERWMLDIDYVFGSGKKDLSILNEFICKEGINQRVTMSLGGDNLLPLDLHNTKSLELLFKELMGGKPIILEECLFSTFSNPVINNTVGTTNEICIPFLLNKGTKKRNNDLKMERIKSTINSSKILPKKKLFPFQKTLYLKVYIKTGIEVDHIFINKFLQLIHILKKKNLFSKFFFIRYLDPHYHFRIRFFGINSRFSKIIEYFNRVFKTEMDELLIDKIQIDTYEPETERYGGEIGIRLSEEMFYHDSICVLKIISWVQNQKKENELWLIAVVGVNQMLEDFSLNTNEKIRILKEIRDYYFSLIENKKETKMGMSNFFRMNQDKIEKHLNLEYFENEFFDYYNIRSIDNKRIISELISNRIKYDIKNYIHMFLNRFFDFNQNIQETIVYDLLIQHYKALKFKKNAKVD